MTHEHLNAQLLKTKLLDIQRLEKQYGIKATYIYRPTDKQWHELRDENVLYLMVAFEEDEHWDDATQAQALGGKVVAFEQVLKSLLGFSINVIPRMREIALYQQEIEPLAKAISQLKVDAALLISDATIQSHISILDQLQNRENQLAAHLLPPQSPTGDTEPTSSTEETGKRPRSPIMQAGFMPPPQAKKTKPTPPSPEEIQRCIQKVVQVGQTIEQNLRQYPVDVTSRPDLIATLGQFLQLADQAVATGEQISNQLARIPMSTST